MPGRLTVCPTPIGNLDDLSPRARRALEDADRSPARTRGAPACSTSASDLRRPRFVSYHEQNEAERARQLVAEIERGARVVLVSDAGTPVISDPGYRADSRLPRAGGEVEVLPGPSAVITALVASGLPADRWRFEGFLPRRGGELERVLQLAGDRGRLRVPPAAADLAFGARDARARPPGGRLPRADQAPRGGRTRHAGRARAAVSRRGQGRDRGRDRAASPAPPSRTWPSRWTRCAASCNPAPARERPRAWSPRSRGRARTTSIAASPAAIRANSA